MQHIVSYPDPIEKRPIVLLLHACRQLPGHTNDNRQADRVTDIKIDNTFMSFLYTWPNPAGSFRGYRTRNCSIQEMLNIRLAYKFLFWSPSCSENSSNKAMKVQLS